MGTDSTTVRMQYHIIVWLQCDTMYVLHGFIPIEETGMVSTVTGMVLEMGTHSVPMKNPNSNRRIWKSQVELWCMTFFLCL